MGRYSNVCNGWQYDNNDGIYINLSRYTDFSDPDIIRVCNDFFTWNPGVVTSKS
jgi:hypothetical protein